MAERDATGGRTPGPGNRGGGGNTSAAAASRIRVDISDVTKLKTAISQTQIEAKKLSKTLADFDDKAIKAVRAAREEIEKLQRALGSSGTRGATGPKQTAVGSSSGVGGSNMHAGSFSGAATVGVGTGGGSYLRTPPGSAYEATMFPSVNLMPQGMQPQGMFSGLKSYLTTPVPSGSGVLSQAKNTPLYSMAAAGIGAVTSIAGLAAGHLADATSRSYLANQFTMASGGSMGMGNQLANNRAFGGMFGGMALGYGDVSQGVGTLLATGQTAGAAGQARFGSAAFLSAINPTQGVAASAQQVAQTFTAQNYYAMRVAGVQMNPNNQNLPQLFEQIISRLEGQAGRRLSPQEIQEVAQAGTGMHQSLLAMGISEQMIPELIRYWQARNRSGMTGRRAVDAASKGTLFRNMQRIGAAKNQALSNVDTGFMPGAAGAAGAKATAINALGDLANTPFGHALGEAAGGLSVFAGELKTVTNALKSLVAWSIAQKFLGGGPGGGMLGKVGGRLGGLGARAGGALFGEGAVTVGGSSLGAVGGVAALDVVAVGTAAKGVSNLPHDFAALGLNDKVKNLYGSFYRKASPAQRAVLDRYRKSIVAGLAATQHQSFWDEVTGNVHTGKLEAAVAQLQNALSQTGDSGQDANIWGGSGQTFKTLEAMAAKGPHEIVTSTTGGKHAPNSYHYKGQAIDLADKPGSVDSPGLLAINRYLAKNYGHKLAELIYAGPGGINIKDGKVVNGLGTYGAATMSEHHNHVHMAATPASLGLSGGVDISGAGGGPQSAASSGGYGTSASGSMLSSLFSTSSGDALIAALSGGGMGGGIIGATGGMGVPGGGQGAAGGSGGPPGAMPKGNLAQWERQALSILNLSYGKYAPGLTALIGHESGGNPHAINLWDSNAKAGHPSKGLMQTIDSTFNAYALPGHKNIWNPVDNIIAGVRYIEKDYGLGMLQGGGRHDAHGNYVGYARGVSEVLRDEMAKLHKGEMVIAAPEASAIRQMVSRVNAGASVGRGGGTTVPVQLIFMVYGGEAEAREHAHRFARYVKEDHDIDMVAMH